MLRRLFFTLACVMSLMLCAATLVQWGRVDSYATVVAIGSHYRTAEIRAEDGIYLSFWTYTFDVEATMRVERPFIRNSNEHWTVDGKTDGYDTPQFSVARTRYFGRPQWPYPTMTQYFVKLPFWFVAAAFLVPPGYGFVSQGRGKRRAGCCAKCGYDLRASTDQCPECGTAIAAKVGAGGPVATGNQN